MNKNYLRAKPAVSKISKPRLVIINRILAFSRSYYIEKTNTKSLDLLKN